MIDKSQYNSLGEWCAAKPADYNSAKRQGHLEAICKLYGWSRRNKPSGYWTKYRCIEEAKNYNTSNDWKRGSGSSYQAAMVNGWLKECSVHFEVKNKPSGYWTKERCIKDALNHDTKAYWERSCSSSHSAARKNGWFDECTKHMKTPFKTLRWTKLLCIKEAQKHDSKSEWRKEQRSSLLAAQKNNWVEECTKHMKK